MTDIVDQTLKLWRQSIFDYGEADCLLSIGDYIASRGGMDIASRFRGTYSTAFGAMMLVEAHGGPQGLIDLTGLPRIDLNAGDGPQRGDVTVLDTGTGPEGCVGALCTGWGIAARLERGLVEIDRRFVKLTHAWKVV